MINSVPNSLWTTLSCGQSNVHQRSHIRSVRPDIKTTALKLQSPECYESKDRSLMALTGVLASSHILLPRRSSRSVWLQASTSQLWSG